MSHMPVHLIECNDPDKLEALAKALYPRRDVVFIDADPFVDAILNSPQGKDFQDKPNGRQIVELFTWHEVENKVKDRAKRARKPVILVTRDLTSTQPCDMARRLSVFFETRLRQWRVIDPDLPPQDPVPPPLQREELEWPTGVDDNMQYAGWLADQLVTDPDLAAERSREDWTPWSLDEMLDMPPADKPASDQSDHSPSMQ